jgi:GHMP kinases C terminal
LGLLVLPLAAELATAAVYAEADRLGLARAPQALEDRRLALLAAWRGPPPQLGAAAPAVKELLHNDLQEAALSLCPEIAGALTQALEAGADVALVSGSGPTVVGLFLADQRLRRGRPGGAPAGTHPLGADHCRFRAGGERGGGSSARRLGPAAQGVGPDDRHRCASQSPAEKVK